MLTRSPTPQRAKQERIFQREEQVGQKKLAELTSILHFPLQRGRCTPMVCRESHQDQKALRPATVHLFRSDFL